MSDLQFEFFLSGSLMDDIKDNEKMQVCLKGAIGLYRGLCFGDVSDQVIEANKHAYLAGKGKMIGHYPFPWDDIVIVGDIKENDVIEATVMYESDFHETIQTLN